MINSLLTQTQKEVYVMDVDPGQPNYNLAGQLTLLKLNEAILTNTDYRGAEIVKGYYLNTPTPNLNISYYNRCVEGLLQHFRTQVPSSLDREKVLIINTCGWVEGLGAEI